MPATPTATPYPPADQVWGCSHVRLLWDAARGGAVVQVDLVRVRANPDPNPHPHPNPNPNPNPNQADLLMDPSMRVRQAMRVGGAAKRKLETLPDVRYILLSCLTLTRVLSSRRCQACAA